MMKKFNAAVDRLPLAGKYALEPAMKGYIKASPEHEKAAFLGNVALLTFFVVAHAGQMRSGIDSFSSHMEHLQATGDTNDRGWMMLDASYAAINGAVTARQISLVGTLDKIHQRKNRRNSTPQQVYVPPELPTQPEVVEAVPDNDQSAPALISEYNKRRLKSVAFALAITVAGQLAFTVSFSDSNKDAGQLACVERAQDAVHQAQNDPGHSPDSASVQQAWAEACRVDADNLMAITIQR